MGCINDYFCNIINKSKYYRKAVNKLMPRPKGSKNKSGVSLDEQIKLVTEEIESIKEKIATKRAELKELEDMKNKQNTQEIMKVAAEILASGRTSEEIIETLRSMIEK